MAQQIGTPIKLQKNVIYIHYLKQKQNKEHSKDVFSTEMLENY